MIKHKTHITKILDGAMSLGASAILPDSLTVNGGVVPANLTVDYQHGTVTRSDTPDKTLYEFEYDYEVPVTASIRAGAPVYTAGQAVALSVDTGDTAQESAVISVYHNDRLIGNYAVALTDGAGEWHPVVAVAGAYRFELANTPTGTYNRPMYIVPGSASVEVIDA